MYQICEKQIYHIIELATRESLHVKLYLRETLVMVDKPIDVFYILIILDAVSQHSRK